MSVSEKISGTNEEENILEPTQPLDSHVHGHAGSTVYNLVHVDLSPQAVLATSERSLEKPEFVLSQKPTRGGFLC